MFILGISGSLRSASTNSLLISVARDCAPPGVEFAVAGGLDQLPHFNPDLEIEAIERVRRWVELVKRADGLVISTPEYARGYPGSLKNALDWLVQTDAHIDKPFMLLNASSRSSVAQKTLTTVLETMSGIHVEAATTTIPLLGKSTSREELLTNEVYVEQIRDALSAFVLEIARIRDQGSGCADQ